VIADRAAFIRENTRLSAPPHCPEIVLHLADDAVALWALTEEQLGQLGLAPPFWAFAWAGGQALARYVLDNPRIVRARRVLDVASGSGLAAIAAMKAGAAQAKAIDIDDMAAAAAALNAAANGVAIEIATGDALAAPPEADIVLIGDLFYDRDLAARLLAWIRTATGAGVDVLIGDPGRSYLPRNALRQIALYEVPVSRALEDSEIKRTSVWRLDESGANAHVGPMAEAPPLSIAREDKGVRGRYVTPLPGGLEAEMTYTRHGDVISILHTGVPTQFEGRGIAAALVKHAVEDARTQGFKIHPVCPYVVVAFERHKEWADVLAS
jgi:predicted nicotinamide N-methyase/predicted GNAT family acetyltransferase